MNDIENIWESYNSGSEHSYNGSMKDHDVVRLIAPKLGFNIESHPAGNGFIVRSKNGEFEWMSHLLIDGKVVSQTLDQFLEYSKRYFVAGGLAEGSAL